MQRVLKHLKENWYKYAFETLVVIAGVLIAFYLSAWNEERKESKKKDMFVEKLKEDLVADTVNIHQRKMNNRKHQESIVRYFSYYRLSDASLDDLIDSARNITFNFSRYLPIDQAFKDMQETENAHLLSEEQRQHLISLSNNQEYLQIVMDKQIFDAKQEIYERNKYLDFNDEMGPDIFQKLTYKLSEKRKIQGLLHIHNMFKALDQFYAFYERQGNVIIDLSKTNLELLSNTKK